MNTNGSKERQSSNHLYHNTIVDLQNMWPLEIAVIRSSGTLQQHILHFDMITHTTPSDPYKHKHIYIYIYTYIHIYIPGQVGPCSCCSQHGHDVWCAPVAAGALGSYYLFVVLQLRFHTYIRSRCLWQCPCPCPCPGMDNHVVRGKTPVTSNHYHRSFSHIYFWCFVSSSAHSLPHRFNHSIHTLKTSNFNLCIVCASFSSILLLKCWRDLVAMAVVWICFRDWGDHSVVPEFHLMETQLGQAGAFRNRAMHPCELLARTVRQVCCAV